METGEWRVEKGFPLGRYCTWLVLTVHSVHSTPLSLVKDLLMKSGVVSWRFIPGRFNETSLDRFGFSLGAQVTSTKFHVPVVRNASNKSQYHKNTEAQQHKTKNKAKKTNILIF